MSENGPEFAPGRAAKQQQLRAFLNEYVDTTDPFRIDHDVQVTSYGGTGTTALTRHLVEAGIRLPKGPGQWPHKHQRVPPGAADVPPGFRVIYVVGDPRNAVLSIFRRKYQVSHYQWLNSEVASEEITARLTSLETFLDGGVDLFGLADHLDHWCNHPPGYDVLMTRYEHLAEAWPEIREFVGLPADHPAFDFAPRESAWETLPRPQRERLDAIYRDLAERVAALPPARLV